MNTEQTIRSTFGHWVNVPPGICMDTYINARLKKMMELQVPSTIQYSHFLREWRPWSGDSEYTSYKRVHFEWKVLDSKNVEIAERFNRILDVLLQEELETTYKMKFDW
jgi:hypothetical protein